MLLKTPIEIGGITLANRLAMPPMQTGKTPDGSIGPELAEHYARRAAGGAVGLVITEHSRISFEGQAGPMQISLASDEEAEAHRLITSALHAAGTKVFAQINHAGSAAPEQFTGITPVSASAVERRTRDGGVIVPRALTRDGIAEIEEQFAAAALRAKNAGYDGVEIHSAHGYLLNQFYSPLTNRRADEYGGSVAGRVRIHVETIRRVRAAVGADFPIAVRLGGCDYIEGGSTIEDSVEASVLLAEAGADMIDLSGGFCGYIRPDGYCEPGYFSDMSTEVKRAVNVPVLMTGGVMRASEAEALLERGAADIIGVGRALFRDPDWALREMA